MIKHGNSTNPDLFSGAHRAISAADAAYESLLQEPAFLALSKASKSALKDFLVDLAEHFKDRFDKIATVVDMLETVRDSMGYFESSGHCEKYADAIEAGRSYIKRVKDETASLTESIDEIRALLETGELTRKQVIENISEGDINLDPLVHTLLASNRLTIGDLFVIQPGFMLAWLPVLENS